MNKDIEHEAALTIHGVMVTLEHDTQQRLLRDLVRCYGKQSRIPATMTGTFERQRMAIAVLYALAAILLLACSGILGRRVFVAVASGETSDLWRFSWVLPFVFLGVAARAFQWRKYDDPPWPAYARYLLKVAIGGFLFFAACHSFLKLDNWLYYPTSALVVFWFGRAPGHVNVPSFGK